MIVYYRMQICYCLLGCQSQCGIYNLTYTIIESMQPSSSDSSSIISEDFSFFLCPCGAEFELLHHYERHLRDKHQLKTIVTPDNHVKKQEPPSRITKRTQQPSINLKVEGKSIEDTVQHDIKSPNRQIRSKEERRRAIETLSKARSFKKSSDLDEETVNWQGFKLIKNNYCHIGPYYCGNCKEILFEIEDYIMHCIQDCQTLIHKDSSHTITLDLKEEATQEVHSDIEDQKNNLQQQNNPQQIGYLQALVNKQFRQILKYGQDHKKIPFYCGQCRRNVSIIWYYRHIANDHGQKMDQNSSHIIVKCFYKSKIRLLYFSHNVRWITQEKQYFCLCNPKQMLKMEDFIQHIKTEHAGISPLYVLSTQSQMKQPKISEALKRWNTSLMSMKKETLPYKYVMPLSHIKQLLSFQNIYDILLKMQDHRSIPFSCGNCLAIFKSPANYKRHIYSCHNEQWSVSNSHVVLQLQNGYDKHNLYMCPSIKWHHDQLIYFCPCSIDNKMSMSSLLQHVITEHRCISPVYFQQTRINRNKIIKKQIYIKNSMNYLQRYAKDHKNVLFSCYPCNLQINNEYQYKDHMRDVHNNTIHPSSSHIIFQFKKYRKDERRRLFVSPHIKWAVAEHSDYYCSCEPERKITMEALIQHIIQNHHGITPEYCFQEYPINNNQYPATRQNSNNKRFECKKYEQ